MQPVVGSPGLFHIRLEMVCGSVWDFLHQHITSQHLPQPYSNLDLGSFDVTTTYTLGEARQATIRHDHSCCQEAPALFWQSKLHAKAGQQEASLTDVLSSLPRQKGPRKKTLSCCLQGVSHRSNQHLFQQLSITLCVYVFHVSLCSPALEALLEFGSKA